MVGAPKRVSGPGKFVLGPAGADMALSRVGGETRGRRRWSQENEVAVCFLILYSTLALATQNRPRLSREVPKRARCVGGRGRLLTHVHRLSACTLNAVRGAPATRVRMYLKVCVWRNLPHLQSSPYAASTRLISNQCKSEKVYLLIVMLCIVIHYLYNNSRSPPDQAPTREKRIRRRAGPRARKLSPTGSWIAVISCARASSPPIREGRDACSCSWAVLRPPERFPSVC